VTAKLAGLGGPIARPGRPATVHPLPHAAVSTAALRGILDRPGPIPVSTVQRLAVLAGNRAIGDLLGPPLTSVAVQRLMGISEVVPPGQRATPKQALTRYLSYLKGESYKYPALEGWLPGTLDALRDEINGAGELSADKIKNFRGDIDRYAAQVRKAEEEARPVVVDSDITAEYKPLKACVLQSLEQFGALGMTAAAYHAQLWRDNDPLKYYDMDTKIGPMYERFGLTETDAEGQSFAELSASLKVGKYVVNVTSPAGPNGHMFSLFVEAPSQKGKPNKTYARQDPANTQSWQPSDKILRYWVKK